MMPWLCMIPLHQQALHLYGDVGTGKTMLMDPFYNTLPTDNFHK